MIRPFTCVCFLLACGSGLYLYQAKHRVNVLDQQIEATVRKTNATREQIRLLHAEWTLLNQPDRLQALANQFLALKPTNPNQFASFAELDSRLPPVPETPPPPPQVAPAQPNEVPVAAAIPSPAEPAPAKPADTPIPPTRHEATDHPRPPDSRPAIHPTVPASAPVAVAARQLPRPAAPVPYPSVWPVRATVPYRAPAQPSGSVSMPSSLLGMARAAAPLPAPMPVPTASRTD